MAAAHLENGLLSVDLVREVPEEMKPRKIEIGASVGTLKQDSQRKQIDHEPERQKNAA